MKRVSTLSFVVGGPQCNARCLFCVAKMSGKGYANPKVFGEPNWRNLEIACRWACAGESPDVMITGKGEPTLWPEELLAILRLISKHPFRQVQLQTNGLLFLEKPGVYAEHLRKFYEAGLTHICLSTVHFNPERNRELILPHKKPGSYPDLRELVRFIHQFGFTVRIICTLTKGWIDSPELVDEEIESVRSWGADQFTMRPVDFATKDSEDSGVYAFAKSHRPSARQLRAIGRHIARGGFLLDVYGHGSELYDYKGIGVCVSNAMTVRPQAESLRQWICYRNGTVTTDWSRHQASILLAGRSES